MRWLNQIIYDKKSKKYIINSYTYSWQSGSSKQSVLVQPLSGGGDVRLESVVQWGKQGSGDQPFVVVSNFTALPPSAIDKLCFSRNIFNKLFYNLTIYLRMSW